jgi:glucan phosphoethanolaminetransferase (alkaline phosphatase superfamily)
MWSEAIQAITEISVLINEGNYTAAVFRLMIVVVIAVTFLAAVAVISRADKQKSDLIWNTALLLSGLFLSTVVLVAFLPRRDAALERGQDERTNRIAPKAIE